MSTGLPTLAGRAFSIREKEKGYGPAWPLLGLGALVLLVTLEKNSFWQGQIVLMIVYALTVSGVNLTFGYAGELALGQVAMFAVGSYLTAYLTTHAVNDLAVAVLASMVAAAVVGLLSGLPGLRIGGWALAMTSFFLVILIPDVDQMIPGITGGAQGFSSIPLPELFGVALTTKQLTFVAVVIAAAWFAAFRNFTLSRHGTALKVLRESPHLAASMGVSVYRIKLLAYLVGSVPAGIAGALFALQQGYVGPTTFTFALAVGVIAGSIIGGTDSVYGAAVGGALLEYINFRSAAFAQYSLVVYGCILLLGGVLTARGLAGIGRRLLAQLDARWAPVEPARGAPPDGDTRAAASAAPRLATGPAEVLDTLAPLPTETTDAPSGVLAVRGLSKRFGGVQALRDVSLEARPGQITGIIGPNGSGKTTMLNVVAGVYRPDAGGVEIGGRRLPSGRPHLAARAGVARTFQTPIIPRGIVAWEVVAAGRYQSEYCSIWRAVLRTPRFRRIRAEDRRLAEGLLEELGLGEFSQRDATVLPLSHRRVLEVARAMIRQPAVLLLDEPAAGLDEGDLEVLAPALRKLRDDGVTVVLVEHNFSLIVELADVIHVLNLGELAATGPPAAIQKDPTVLSIYLGAAAPAPSPAAPTVGTP